MQELDLKQEKALMVGVIHGEVDEASAYEHLEELETHVELKETQLQHLEEENRSLMQRLGLKKPG